MSLHLWLYGHHLEFFKFQDHHLVYHRTSPYITVYQCNHIGLLASLDCENVKGKAIGISFLSELEMRDKSSYLQFWTPNSLEITHSLEKKSNGNLLPSHQIDSSVYLNNNILVKLWLRHDAHLIVYRRLSW